MFSPCPLYRCWNAFQGLMLMSCASGVVASVAVGSVLLDEVVCRVRDSVCCERSRCCSCGVAYLQHGSITCPEGA